MIKLADQVLGSDDPTKQAEDQTASQRILAEAAKARLENAKIAREIAQIKLREFTDGQYLQDLAQAVGEIKIAEEEVKILPERTKQAKDRLNEIKQVSKGSAVELSIEFDAEGKVVSAQLAEQRARYALQMAESKKKIMVEYTKQKALLDLRSAVEKARAD